MKKTEPAVAAARPLPSAGLCGAAGNLDVPVLARLILPLPAALLTRLISRIAESNGAALTPATSAMPSYETGQMRCVPLFHARSAQEKPLLPR